MLRLVGLALVGAVIMSACRSPALTPISYLVADLKGRVPDAEGRASLRSLGPDRTEISIELPLGSGVEWSASIRSGTCADPGPVRFLAGVIEGGSLLNSFDGTFGSTRGQIVVVTRLGGKEAVSCGVIG